MLAPFRLRSQSPGGPALQALNCPSLLVISKRILAHLGLALWAGLPAYAQEARVEITPTDAQFTVRHILGEDLPGGPRADQLLPSGSSFPAGIFKGQRGILVHVEHPGYLPFDRKYALAPNKEYWTNGGWDIPIELEPDGPFNFVRHQLRFHPALPMGLAAALLLVGGGLLLSGRGRQQSAESHLVKAEARAADAFREFEEASAASEASLIGAVIGSYRVEKHLGEGGFAQVNLVQHLESGQRFAMKILRKGSFMSAQVQRLEREIEIGRTLVHPNLVMISGYGEYEGLPYFVMEYVEGEDLADILSERRLSLREALAFFRQMCLGVAYAHKQGIIHRDLKPENMMCTADGTLRLLDFGVAKPVVDQHKLTRTGEVFGTPSYMSPERLMEGGDTRTDIYSLGVILFELVTGTLPFTATDPVELMSSHFTLAPPKMSSFVKVPPRLERLCERMLEKDPSARIQTVDEVIEILDDINLPASA